MALRSGQIIQIIYQDKAGRITQRRIEVKGIRDGRVRATCLATGSPRVFLLQGILAWQPERRHA